jgi:membrane protease YdiL (CAAX protease family)
MRYLTDPALLTPGLPAWFVLAFVSLVGPYGALKGHRRISAGTLRMTRPRIYLNALVWQGGLVWLSWTAAHTMGLPLFPRAAPTARDVAVGAAALLVGLATLHPRLRVTSALGQQRVRMLAPRTAGEQGLFYVVAAGAAVAEEMTYRGVVFTLFALLTGSWWAGALLSAAVFGGSHLAQGPRTAAIVVLYGVRDQVVVGLTGTLYVAMGVHLLHDAIVGTVAARRARRADALDAAAAAAAAAVPPAPLTA